MSLIKTNVPGYLKDEETKLIINNNQAEFDLYKAARLKVQQSHEAKNEVLTLKQQVESLHNDMSDIKNLLTQLLEKK